ncbi:hypothetical protein HU200_065716 [Digitaria exilis]|uniref:Uncharacterized protein n=1 Tax=Digitaria exilis TaxID=1010633 RepID=A0A834ZXQ9_9POAL|nr:hypothetical protein HU200_065716 [Digitaria exilis]
MSLDLKDERVVFVATLPVRVGPHDLYGLFNLTTDLRGRLVVAVGSHEMKRTRMLKRVQTKVTKVWTLDVGGGRNKKRPAWFLRCKVVEPGQDPYRGIAWPHVTHGEHVLTTVTTGARGVNRSVPRRDGEWWPCGAEAPLREAAKARNGPAELTLAPAAAPAAREATVDIFAMNFATAVEKRCGVEKQHQQHASSRPV